MRQILAESNGQGWRFSIYGVILIYLLFIYSSDDSFLAFGAIKDSSLSTAVAGVKKHLKSGFKAGSKANLYRKNEPRNTNNNSIERFPHVGSAESHTPNNIIVSDSSSFEHRSPIEEEIKNLLQNRAVIYDEKRTLTVSEIAELHGITNSEDSPFAITNEAQLILRELAVEHRIPQVCAENLSDECLMVLERSQAGSIPPECQELQNDGECEKAFSRFWE